VYVFDYYHAFFTADIIVVSDRSLNKSSPQWVIFTRKKKQIGL